MSMRARWLLLCLVVAVVAVGTLYVSAFFSMLIGESPVELSLRSSLGYWFAHGLQSKADKMIVVSCAALAAVMLLSASFQILTPKVALHGQARFATSRDLKKAKLFAKKGIILAKYGHKYLVFDGQEFVLVAAPTRSGKGVSIVIPNLLNWQDSVFVMDVKEENFRMTSGWRQRVLKQKVFLFAPFSEEGKTSRWNPLDAVSRDPSQMVADVMQMAQVFYPSNAGDKNRFFQDSAQRLFCGLALYLIETCHERTTLGELFRQGSGYGKPLPEHVKAILEEHPNLSNACKTFLSGFLSLPGETFGNIRATFEAALQIFAIPTLDWATSASDFDVREVRRERMSIYLGINPDKLDMSSRLFNLFITQLIYLNTRVLPEDDPTLQHQCLLVNDEFTAPGPIEVIRKAVAFIAGYNLRLLTIVQGPSQMRDATVYGKEGADTIMVNHAVRVIFPPHRQEEAKEYSEMLGTFSLQHASTSVNRSGKGIGNINDNVSFGSTISDQKRALLMPQELKQLERSAAIVDLQGMPPAMAEKAYYYKDPIFLQRLAQVSPSLLSILAEGRDPSQEELIAIRVKGEFTAKLVTAAFDPYTHQAPRSITVVVATANQFDLQNPETLKSLEDNIPDFSESASIDDWLAAVEQSIRNVTRTATGNHSEAKA